MNLVISSDFENAGVAVAVGAVAAEVAVGPASRDLDRLLDTAAAERTAELGDGPAASVPAVSAARAAYKSLGKDPSRYRPAAEALTRRLIQGKGLYRVNNIVDINNLVSIRSGVSIGAFDRAALMGDLTFRRGRAGETFQGIGRGDINLDGLPLFADDEGPFGSTTSDSERTKITERTRRLLMVLIDFGGGVDLAQLMDDTVDLLERFAAASEVETDIFRG